MHEFLSLFYVGFDWLAAMDLQHQHSQHIGTQFGSGFVLARVWPRRQYNMKVQVKICENNTFQ